MRQRRDAGEQLGLDRLARDQELDRLDARLEGGVDEVLALGDEQAELVALPRRGQLAHELQPRVRCRRDQLRHATQAPWY